jgi:4-hydroxybenzoate polyprenyltransferase
MKMRMQLPDKLSAHLENILFSHSIFALPFAYMGAFLAAGATPKWGDLFWITVAMVGARSAAMALNNLIDLEYDRLQPRFAKRPMVTGRINTQEAVIFILASLLVFWIAAMNLAPLCRELWLFAIIPLVIYPYMKRISFICHFVLGFAISIAPVGAWIAIQNEVSPVAILLGFSVAAWIAGFDIIYACQDVNFDKRHRLHSVPVQFGIAKALRISEILHAICVLGFVLIGLIMGLGYIYYLGIVLVACVLIYQHNLISPINLKDVNHAYFMRNGLVSVILLVFTVLAQK